ncbi:Ig-like domain-containing protein, partial [Acinetobacter sp. CFCC 11171]
DVPAAPNKPPVAENDTVTTEHGTPVEKNILTNDTDPENDPLVLKDFTVGDKTYQPGETAELPGVGTITVDKDGNLTFTPEAGYTGSVPDVTYTVTDGKGGEAQGTVTF